MMSEVFTPISILLYAVFFVSSMLFQLWKNDSKLLILTVCIAMIPFMILMYYEGYSTVCTDPSSKSCLDHFTLHGRLVASSAFMLLGSVGALVLDRFVLKKALSG